MKKCKRSNTIQSLRFTSWSRKSYAAFKSIGRQVTIGRLKNVVADALLGKQKNVIPELPAFLQFYNKNAGDPFAEPPDDEMQIGFLFISALQQEKVYCGNSYHKTARNNFNRLKAFIHKAFSRFVLHHLN